MIFDFFLLALDRETGEPIGKPPVWTGTAHFKLNVATFMFVLSYVRKVANDTFVAEIANDLARTFVADVYGRPEGTGTWKLLASGRPTVDLETVA